MADHLTKALSRMLFHRHADYLLGHIPPKYLAVHDTILNHVNSQDNNIVQYVPTSFTTPATAKASRIFKPAQQDYAGHPWMHIVWWNEAYNSHLAV